MSKTLKFPKKFLWGAAVSSYQVEGGIDNCDWSEKFPAGKACDYYNQYEKYFDLAKELNQNAHRFSLEWSRIQPSEGKFDREAIEHYRRMLLALKERKIKSMVTIWHWTIPAWFEEMGGWRNPKAAEYFARYAKFVAEELDDLVDYWITLNEPMIYVSFGYILGIFPPHKRNLLSSFSVLLNLAEGHKKAYKIIHEINKNALVSIAENCAYAEPQNKNSFFDKSATFLWEYLRTFMFFDLIKEYLDYLGINYYFHDKVKFTPFKFPFFNRANENKIVSDLGWEIYPEGIYHVIMHLKKYNLPIYITENGLADAKDANRLKFIEEHLKWMHKAIEDGVDVKGYMHWSLIDNFEWTFGFSPRFGLMEMNYKTMEAKIRPSARRYAEICKENEIAY